MNNQLLSDEELKNIKDSMSEEEIHEILDSKFSLSVSADSGADNVVVTALEIEQTLGNNDIEKVLFNNKLNDDEKTNLLCSIIPKYIAARMGVDESKIGEPIKCDSLKEAMLLSYTNYINSYVDYETPFGIFKIQRKDVSMLNGCYRAMIYCMIYVIISNFFPGLCVGNSFMYLIGTFLNVLLSINIIKVSVKVWRLTLDEKNNQ